MYILGVVLIFVTVDLFYFAKSSEDKFEPYYQRLNKREKEAQRLVYENKLKQSNELDANKKKEYQKRINEINNSNKKKTKLSAKLGFGKKDSDDQYNRVDEAE